MAASLSLLTCLVSNLFYVSNAKTRSHGDASFKLRPTSNVLHNVAKYMGTKRLRKIAQIRVEAHLKSNPTLHSG